MKILLFRPTLNRKVDQVGRLCRDGRCQVDHIVLTGGGVVLLLDYMLLHIGYGRWQLLRW